MLLLALLVPLVGAGYQPALFGPSFGHNHINLGPNSQLSHLNNRRFFSPILSNLPNAKALPDFKYNEYDRMNKQAGCHAECMLNLRVLGDYYKKHMDDVECVSHCFNELRPVPGPSPVHPILPPPVRPVVPVNPPKGRFYFDVLNKLPSTGLVALSPQEFEGYKMNPKAGCYADCMNNLKVLSRYYDKEMTELDCVDECFSSHPSGPKPGPHLPNLPQPVRPSVPVNPPQGRFYLDILNHLPDTGLVRLSPQEHAAYASNPMAGCFADCRNNLKVLSRYYDKHMSEEDCVDECYNFGPKPNTNGVSYPHGDHTHHLAGIGDYGLSGKYVNGNNVFVPGANLPNGGANNTLAQGGSRLGRLSGQLRVYGGR